MVFNPLKYQPEDDSDSESDDSSSDSDSDSDYDTKRRRKLKKKKKAKRSKKTVDKDIKPVQQFQGSDHEIEGMIQQLNTMSLQDPKYGQLYYKVMTLDTTGLAQKCVYREPLHFIQPQVNTAKANPPRFIQNRPPSTQNTPVTYPNNIPLRNRNVFSQTAPMRCYGCSGKDHMLGECPRMKELLSDGIVTMEMATHKYYMPDGRTIVWQA